MSRAKWKVPYLDITRIRNIFFKTRKTQARSSTIPFILLNKYVEVHNGKKYKKILITRNKIGYKFGEFASTRILPIKKKKNKRKPKPKSKSKIKTKK
jgi:ribosomal protein S19